MKKYASKQSQQHLCEAFCRRKSFKKCELNVKTFLHKAPVSVLPKSSLYFQPVFKGMWALQNVFHILLVSNSARATMKDNLLNKKLF